MQSASEFFDLFLSQCGPGGLAALSVLLVLFIVQITIYIRGYGRLAKYRIPENAQRQQEGISVIVPIGDDHYWLDNILPRLAGQKYDRFEVIAVCVGTTEDFRDELEMRKASYPQLSSTRLDSDPRFPINDKMAYNVGIKAAKFPNIILTRCDATPSSDRWLSLAARSFSVSRVVIGYCGLRVNPGFTGKLLRSGNFMRSVRYLSAAAASHPYRTAAENFGLSRESYFNNRGFDHLNMNPGIEDLFLQKLTATDNCTLMLNPAATLCRNAHGSANWWWEELRYRTSTIKYYPGATKFRIGAELWTRAMFFTAAILCFILLPPYYALGALGLFIARSFIVSYQLWRVRRRIGEKGIRLSLVVHDFISPFYEAALGLARIVRTPAGVNK